MYQHKKCGSPRVPWESRTVCPHVYSYVGSIRVYFNKNSGSTFFSMQKGSSLQQSWLTRVERSLRDLSRQMQAKRDEVSTQLLTDDVLAHASITFSVAFTSISAIHFWKHKKKGFCYQKKKGQDLLLIYLLQPTKIQCTSACAIAVNRRTHNAYGWAFVTAHCVRQKPLF